MLLLTKTDKEPKVSDQDIWTCMISVLYIPHINFIMDLFNLCHVTLWCYFKMLLLLN